MFERLYEKNMSKHDILLASRALESPPREGGFVLLKDIGLQLSEFDVHMLSQKDIAVGSIKPEKVYSRTGWDSVVKLQFFLGLLMKAHKYRVVHTAHIPTPQNVRLIKLAIWLARLRGTRFLQTITGLPAVNDEELPRLLWGDYVVCQSPNVLDRIESLTSVNHRLIVPWPSPQRLLASSRREGDTRSELMNKYDAETLVVFPGEFERMNIGTDFAECIESFLELQPKALIVLACRFDNLGIGQKIAEKFQNRVLSLGSTSNIVGLMDAADLVIFPTRKMDSKFHPPLIITEALTLGTTVVVSDLIDMDPASTPRLHKVDAGKPWPEFSKAMHDALSIDRKSAGDSRKFEYMVKDYHSIYTKLVDSEP